MEFKAPSAVPQDLQLIQDIVGEPSWNVQKAVVNGAIHYAGSDTDSEREVEENILGTPDEEDSEHGAASSIPLPSDTTSDSDSSDSDSDSDEDDLPGTAKPSQNHDELAMDFDEDTGPAVTSESQMRTKNEILEPPVAVPEVEEVGAHEPLEKVGEVMSIIDKRVIVKGAPQSAAKKVYEKALDTDTLLVFEDRKVLGYVYETFGPTCQPFYQVKFDDKYPLDPEKVRVSREVFHVPGRSNVVFVSQLKRFKGSDASNAHDEEPAEDELEFSDDEEERAHKRALAERRGASSRLATPTPSHARDQDAAGDLYGASPYDNAYNDMDFGAGPSRPPPIPYDDPYAETYGVPDAPLPSPSAEVKVEDGLQRVTSERGRGRGRGKGPARDGMAAGRREERGRGRGRGRGAQRGERGRGRGRGGGGEHWHVNGQQQPQAGYAEEESRRSLSPTSMAIARATGQYHDGSSFAAPVQNMASASDGYAQQQQQQPESEWAYQQQQGYGYPPPQFVQPHINPRFAAAFGLSYGYGGFGGGYGQYGMGYGGGGWTAEEDVHPTPET